MSRPRPRISTRNTPAGRICQPLPPWDGPLGLTRAGQHQILCLSRVVPIYRELPPYPRGQAVRTRFKPCSAVFAPLSLGKSCPSPASVSLCKDSCTFLMWWAIRCHGHARASTVPCFTWPPECAPLPPKTSSQHQLCSLGELPPSLPCAVLGHLLYAGCLTSQNTAWCLPS